MALTERQEEIQDLLDKGKSPTEIGVALDITTNAVYQQLRRMHKSGGGRRKSRGRPARSRARQSGTQPQPSGTAAAMPTPLQAIRSRRQAIEAELRESKQIMDEAVKAAARQSEGHKRLQDGRDDELKQLQKAETALTGKPAVRAARSRPRRRSGSAKTSTGSNNAGDAKQVRKPAAA